MDPNDVNNGRNRRGNPHNPTISFDNTIVFEDIFPNTHINVKTGMAIDLPALPDINEDDWLEYYEDDDSSHSTDDSVAKLVMEELMRSKTDQEQQELRGRKRNHAIAELLSTERTYVDLMTKLLNHYVKKLKTKKSILSYEDYQKIFPSCIAVVHNLNSTFLFDLQTVLQSNKLNQSSTPTVKQMKTLGIVMTDATLGDMLMKFSPHFAMYKAYCSNYEASGTRLAILRKKSSSGFSKYCDKMSASVFNNLSLEQLLILPIQRMPRYKLLLQEIIKHTEDNHPDLEQLTKALAEINKVNDSINQNIKELEARVEVQNIENRFKGKVNNLVTPSRRYIRSGRLCKLESDDQVYYLFILFNDSILYASESMFGNKLIFGNLMEFNSRFNIRKTSGPLKLVSNIKNLFEIHSTQDSFMLFADSQRSMNKWCKIISKTYEEFMSSGIVKQEEGLYFKTLFLPHNFAEKCMVKGCTNRFSMINRRCHCDFCGFLVCSSCRKQKVKHKSRGKVRVCDVCFRNYSKIQMKNKQDQLQRMNTQKLTEAALNALSPIKAPSPIAIEFKDVPNFNPLNRSIARKRHSTMMKQSGMEERLVTGFLRKLSLECKLSGSLGQNIVYLCNLSYGAIKKQKVRTFNKRFSTMKRKKIQY